MKKRTNIAVLMPVYNPGTELVATLDGLRAQSVPFQLFLVDDGSRTKPDYAKLTHGLNCETIELAKNVGVAGALNAGLAEILKQDFELVARIDNGDICAPTRFAKQQAFLEQRPDVSILGSWVEMVYAESGKRFVLNHPSGFPACKRMMWSNMPTTHPSLMIRASLFKNIGLYSHRYDAAEDYDLIRRTADAGLGIDNVQEVLLHKIETSDSISWKKRDIQLNSRLAIQWEHRDLTNLLCVRGIVKTALIRATPHSILRQIKQTLGRN
jgi:GT2 family glycosyltransferase